MKLFYFVSLLGALGSVALGQAEQNQSALENAPVLDEVVHQQGKDTLVIQRIEQPEFLEDDSIQEETDESPPEVQLQEAVLPTRTYIISATSYGPGIRLQIWPSHQGQQGALEGFSNIDWSAFQSLLSFDGNNVRYQFMLF